VVTGEFIISPKFYLFDVRHIYVSVTGGLKAGQHGPVIMTMQ